MAEKREWLGGALVVAGALAICVGMVAAAFLTYSLLISGMGDVAFVEASGRSEALSSAMVTAFGSGICAASVSLLFGGALMAVGWRRTRARA